MPNTTVKVKPTTREIVRELDRLRRSVLNTNTVHGQIASMLDNWVQRNFKEQGKSVGGWAPLKAGGRYISHGKGKKRTFDSSAKVLQDTGRLRASFLPFHNKKTAGIGSNVKYSLGHEEGNPPNLPQRRMLPIQKEVAKDIRKKYEDHIEREIKRFQGKI